MSTDILPQITLEQLQPGATLRGRHVSNANRRATVVSLPAASEKGYRVELRHANGVRHSLVSSVLSDYSLDAEPEGQAAAPASGVAEPPVEPAVTVVEALRLGLDVHVASEDRVLLEALVSRRGAELADEGIAATPETYVRGLIRKAARTAGLLVGTGGQLRLGIGG